MSIWDIIFEDVYYKNNKKKIEKDSEQFDKPFPKHCRICHTSDVGHDLIEESPGIYLCHYCKSVRK